MNEQQLTLIETPAEWKLDDRTKEVGKEGLRHARAKLRSSRSSTDAPADRKAA